MKKHNYASILTIPAIGTTGRDNPRRQRAKKWLCITTGVQIGAILSTVANIPLPLFLLVVLETIAWVGVIITQFRDLYQPFMLKLSNDKGHIPLVVTDTLQFGCHMDPSGKGHVLPVFDNKYRCEKKGNTYVLRGRPSSEMETYVKQVSAQNGFYIFRFKKAQLEYTLTEDTDYRFAAILDDCSKKQQVYIQEREGQGRSRTA